MTELKAGARRRKPTHPGAIVKTNLYEMGISAYAAAPLIGITKAALGNVINQKSAVSPEMALRLGKFFGNGPELWMGLQVDYDLWTTREKLKHELARIESTGVTALENVGRLHPDDRRFFILRPTKEKRARVKASLEEFLKREHIDKDLLAQAIQQAKPDLDQKEFWKKWVDTKGHEVEPNEKGEPPEGSLPYAVFEARDPKVRRVYSELTTIVPEILKS